MSIFQDSTGNHVDLAAFLARPDGILIADGAMGTLLLGMGFKPPLETLNLTHPDVIRDIHQSYAGAGARLIYTHTFGAHTERFRAMHVDADLDAIISEAVINARQAAPDAMVAGNIGPCGVAPATWREWSEARLRQGFSRTAEALATAGVDAFALETFTSLTELKAALAAVAWVNKRRVPVIASVSANRDGTLGDGTAFTIWMQELHTEDGVDVIGLNCAFGPADMARVVRELCENSAKPVAVKLNAGLPEMIGQRPEYSLKPAQFARQMADLRHPRLRIVGGCCGTTPEHVATLAALPGVCVK